MTQYPQPQGTQSFSLVQPAVYQNTGSDRYNGNPFIEALDPIREPEELESLYEVLPPEPTDVTRGRSLTSRRNDLNQLHDVVVLFPQYLTAAEAVNTLIREAYHYRNPFSTVARQHRYAQAWAASGQTPISNWKSTALGHIIMAISGMGKTTFMHNTLMDFPRVIKHESYHGNPFAVYQIPILTLRIPHDGTIRSLCVQFFEQVDELLGTKYAVQAGGRMSIGPMIDLMKQVATTVSLGLLVIDEVQNLRSARSGNAEFVLNLFSEMIEKVGISIVVIATPALEPVINDSVRNTRKLVSGGCTIIPPMQRDGIQWQYFTETLWEYQYVKNKTALTETIRGKWHELSGGNSAFAALLFYMAQKAEMGGSRERLDEFSFQRAYDANLAFLHPAIQALRSGNPNDLTKFDDMMVSPRWQHIRSSMGVKELPVKAAPGLQTELAGVPEPTNPSESPKPSKKGSGTAEKIVAPALQSENPLNVNW